MSGPIRKVRAGGRSQPGSMGLTADADGPACRPLSVSVRIGPGGRTYAGGASAILSDVVTAPPRALSTRKRR
jgi:hypothetical protein